jgi:hypothetical protein
MNRHMRHIFITSPTKTPMDTALRRAQVLGLGGSEQLLHAILGGRTIESTAPPESFWATVIHWFCNQDDLDLDQVGPLIDYILHRWNEDSSFEMKGRSVQALVRGMKSWHKELAQIQKGNVRNYKRSGLDEGIWIRPRKVAKNKTCEEVWTMEEIKTSRELIQEGRAMKHCVASYSGGIKGGGCSIWSLRREGRRLVTVEVRNRARRVTQARGLQNRRATPGEKGMIQRWALENGLEVARWCW